MSGLAVVGEFDQCGTTQLNEVEMNPPSSSLHTNSEVEMNQQQGWIQLIAANKQQALPKRVGLFWEGVGGDLFKLLNEEWK